MSDFGLAALAAGQAGFPVFPIRPRGKSPLRKNWQGSATTDLQVIESTWQQVPQANIGIATGRGLVVIDTDNPTALADYDLPATTTVETSRGRHYYYRGEARSRAGVLPGVDVRGRGGLVVGAGSLHPSGALYTWKIPPWELAPQPLPDSLKALLARRKGAEAALYVTSCGGLRTPSPIPRGRRKAAMFSFARSLVFQTGLRQEEILPTLLEINKRCVPPLEPQQIRDIARSAVKYEFAPWIVDPLGFRADPRLRPPERAILGTLASYADPGGKCFPSVETIRRDTGYDRHTIHRAIDGLVVAGRIAVERGASRIRSNRYQLLPWEG